MLSKLLPAIFIHSSINATHAQKYFHTPYLYRGLCEESPGSNFLCVPCNIDCIPYPLHGAMGNSEAHHEFRFKEATDLTIKLDIEMKHWKNLIRFSKVIWDLSLPLGVTKKKLLFLCLFFKAEFSL